MNERELRGVIEDVRQGRLSRRAFTRAMIALGLTAPLAAQMLASSGVAMAASGPDYKPTRRGGGGALKVLWWQGPTLLNPHFATGTIVFANDNPSGLAANAKSFSIPVAFSQAAPVGGNSSGTTATAIVKGQVILGPTCPVESNPPDPKCAPRPYQTMISISKNIETPTAFKTMQSDAAGLFSVSLAPGEYDFYVQATSALPRCAEQLVTVKAGQTSNITINCDTGIR